MMSLVDSLNGASPRLLLVLLLATGLVFSGCLGSDEGPDGPDSVQGPGPAYETKIHYINESGYAETSIWNGAEGNTRTFPQNFAISRPEHLHEATFVLNWTSATEPFFSEARLAVGGSFMYLWKETTGTGTLELSVDDHEWGEMYNTIRVYILPYDSDRDIALQVDWEWAVEIKMVERIPLGEPEGEAGDEENGRGTGSPG